MMSSKDDGMSVMLTAAFQAPLLSTPPRAVPLGPSNKTMKKGNSRVRQSLPYSSHTPKPSLACDCIPLQRMYRLRKEALVGRQSATPPLGASRGLTLSSITSCCPKLFAFTEFRALTFITIPPLLPAPQNDLPGAPPSRLPSATPMLSSFDSNFLQAQEGCRSHPHTTHQTHWW
jgi:hypothetical protein